MHDFTLQRPAAVADALAAVADAEDGQFMAGGQTLIPVLKQRLAMPSDLVDLSGVADLKGITAADGTVSIGAMTTHAAVAGSAAVAAAIPALADLAGQIGDPHVRNRGTLGGSIANNDPAADYPAAVVGLGATVVTDRRTIAADDFFVDLFETALEDGELVVRVDFPVPDAAAYMKFPNPASRYAVVGVFV
ncbi:MAG: FAD binding domain-containing protein, partial [Rhodospirillaceae bacterium]